jgi:hypothetical protein
MGSKEPHMVYPSLNEGNKSESRGQQCNFGGARSGSFVDRFRHATKPLLHPADDAMLNRASNNLFN